MTKYRMDMDLGTLITPLEVSVSCDDRLLLEAMVDAATQIHKLFMSGDLNHPSDRVKVTVV